MQFARRVSKLAGAAALAGAALLWLGFGIAAADDEAAKPDPAALKKVWQDLLKAAQDGDEDKGKEFLQKTTMTEDDFVAVIADEAKAKELAAKYKEKYAKHDGMWADPKSFMKGMKDGGFDTVKVDEATAGEKNQSDTDKKVVPLLKKGTKMFTVHLSKGKKGRVYREFFFVKDHWVSGLNLSGLLEEKKDEGKSDGD